MQWNKIITYLLRSLYEDRGVGLIDSLLYGIFVKTLLA